MLFVKPDIPLMAHLSEVTMLGAELAGRLGLPKLLEVKALFCRPLMMQNSLGIDDNKKDVISEP